MKKRKLPRWTEAEHQIIREEVANNPENMSEAFQAAANRLRGRSRDAVAYKWYSQLKREDSVFKLQSKSKSIDNTKVTKTKGLNIISYDRMETTYHNVTFKVGKDLVKADTLTL